MPFCIQCGNETDIKQAFCSHCGSDLRNKQTRARGIIDVKKIGGKFKVGWDMVAASRSKRIGAAIFDLMIGVSISLVAYYFMLKRIFIFGPKIRWMLMRVVLFFLPALFFIVRDGFKGKSPGKLAFGLTTMNVKSGESAGLLDSLLRNALLALVVIPVLGWIAFAVLAAIIGVQIIQGNAMRLGDHFAHTAVIEDKPIKGPIA